ncbi:Na+ dependent nucleoside transporter C-terminus-domain-containing protein [Apiosordaria backusii]|uniref:Na+ dependent nucleoside transporter C-terminus-domain-containing protein n=1 Tax=Apiosordaria backusii TaxID=314023 RepID=A0AA39ZY49_9PEZI|nr:Na+ dependent nucleoside transporter C-terminus-domain-containing protein [Apiosordaria backusii]
MATNDNIEPSASAYPAQTTTLQQQSSASTDTGYPDEKNASAPVDQYAVDPEKQSTRVGSLRADSDKSNQRPSFLSRHWKLFAQAAAFILFTVWWIYGLIKYRHTDGKGWLIPTLIYICICLRVFFNFVPSSLVMRPVRTAWKYTAVQVYDRIPTKLHHPLAALVALAVFLIGTFVPEETGDNTRANRAISIFGLVVMLALLTLTSRDWKIIPWRTVIGGMLSQYIIAVFVLRTRAGYDIFKFISDMAGALLGFAKDGLIFLTDADLANSPWFLTSVIPAIIFFIALVQMLYHVGFLAWFIQKFAVFFFWSLRVSGAEAIVASATPFIGQGESAVLIRPFMDHLTKAEIHQIMTCGFATIAGSVLVAYIGMGLNPQALVSSCIMSIPATLAVSKMRWPETEEPITMGKVEVPKNEEDEHTVNALHAFTNGSWLGLKIGATIVACLLTTIAFVALINGLLKWWGGYWGLNEPGLVLSIQLILSRVLYPVAWLLGVPQQDLLLVAELIGTKVVINEFKAFADLVDSKKPFIHMLPRSKLIATYACCGFGNIGSLGIQIGVLSTISPKRSGDVVTVSISAFFCGVLCTLTSASIAGMLFNDGMMSMT